MDLNFSNVNGFPFQPTRHCLKSTGPGDSALIAIAARRERGSIYQQSRAGDEDIRKPFDFPKDALVKQIETGCERKPGIAQRIERQFLQDLTANIRHRGNADSLESQPRERFRQFRPG